MFFFKKNIFFGRGGIFGGSNFFSKKNCFEKKFVFQKFEDLQISIFSEKTNLIYYWLHIYEGDLLQHPPIMLHNVSGGISSAVKTWVGV